MTTQARADGVEPPTAAPSRLALVLNENAGAFLADPAAADTLRQHLLGTGVQLEEPPPGKLPDRLRAALRDDADMILVAGGDGTVACAASVLAGRDTALAVLPCGTMNLLARDLGLPIADLPGIADIIREGHCRRIDVGMVSDLPFLCACMMGSPARIGRHREQARRHGWFWQWPRLLRAALRSLSRDRPQRFRVVSDGVEQALRTPSLTITLGAVDNAAAHLFGRSNLETGLLWAYALHPASLPTLARALWRLARGHPRDDPAITAISGREIAVSARGATLRVMVDGEVHLLPAPVRFSVRPRALRVVVPR